jgi:hypothetical protein
VTWNSGKERSEYNAATWGDDEKRSERKHRRHAISEWREAAKTIGDHNHNLLRRDTLRIALTNQEEAARTYADFERILYIWDKKERTEADRIGKQETINFDTLLDYELPDSDRIIPTPLNHIWWRSLLMGNFIDVIHDCPHEIYELTSSRSVSECIMDLDENRREIFYYWAIRLWTPQKIAAFRGQTDRNIRKVYSKMIKDMRTDLFERLFPRYQSNKPLTYAQREFDKCFREQLNEEQTNEIEKRIEDTERCKGLKYLYYDGADI